MDDGWTGEGWRRVDELFAAALELDPDDRATYLDDACGDDLRLRERVEELLAAAEAADDFVDRSEDALARAARGALDANRDAGGLVPGTRLGSYRILGHVGRGGMGTVYRAERADGAFEQTVALKVLRRGLDTDDVLARFRAERQILASFSHRHIARLVDGGATDDGRPYLAMEYVEGEPVDAYCDGNRLPVEERLRLFRHVCDAVAHAHRSLVVHRDLKPGNVLVTSEGEPKLLDFGIAKLLEPEAVMTSAPLTRTGVRLLSPLYASPEQVEGGRVTTATDVYALGVMLYELVTGHHPHEGEEKRTAREVERAIAEEPPARPEEAVTTSRTLRTPDGQVEERTPEEIARSRATDPEALRRRVSGDLGAVLLKALRKEPEQRYASAERLSEELGRYLERRPVAARRGTWRYRASKFVRRHAAGVAAAVLVLVTLAGGIVATTWQARRASEAADAARVEARNAREVTDLLVDLFRAPDAAEATAGDTLTARAVLERGVERVRDELDGQPEVRARMLHVTGEVYGNLGLYDRGRPLLEEALETRRELYGDQHAEVAESLEALATLYTGERDFQEAVPLYREELQLRRALLPDTALEVANTAQGLAMALRDAGRADTAAEVMRDVLELKRRLLGPDDHETLTAQAGLAYALRSTGKLQQAEALYRDVLPRMREADVPPADMARTLNNLAYVVKVRDDPEEAAKIYREGLRHARRAHGEGHPFSLMVLVNLASALETAGDSAGAVDVLKERLRLARAAYPGGHWRVGSAAHSLGVALDRQRRHREAERHFRQTLEIWGEELGEDHEWTARARGQLGGCLLSQGRYAEAEPLLLESHAVLSKSRAPDAPLARRATERLVTLYGRSGRETQAQHYREKLAALESPED